MAKRILLLGGYGLAGSALARLLAQHRPELQLTLAGRQEAPARALAGELHAAFGCEAHACVVDATDPVGLRRSIEGHDLVVVASPTSHLAAEVGNAVLDCGADYFDLQLSAPEKIAALKALEPAIRRAGRTFITDGGFHPGLPALLIRFAATRLPKLSSAKVFSLIRSDWSSVQSADATALEMVAVLADFSSKHLQNGRWKTMGVFGSPISYDFVPPFGRQACTPMWLDELGLLPDAFPDLRNTGFFIGGFNPVTDYLILPAALIGMKIAPKLLHRPIAGLFRKGLGLTQPPYGVHFVLEAEGEEKGRKIRRQFSLFHPDEYHLTAAPAAACLFQYLDSAPRPGLWHQAWYAEPERFFTELGTLGLEVQATFGAGKPVAKV